MLIQSKQDILQNMIIIMVLVKAEVGNNINFNLFLY